MQSSSQRRIVERFVVRMLQRRGSIHDVAELEWEGPNCLYARRTALIYFVDTGKVTTDVMKTILKMSAGAETLIGCPNVVVYANTITPDAKHALESKTVRFEPFSFDEMSFDLIEAVPEHSRVDGEKPKDWRKYPVILSTDIVARYYGFIKDDVVRIELDDGTITYRRCV